LNFVGVTVTIRSCLQRSGGWLAGLGLRLRWCSELTPSSYVTAFAFTCRRRNMPAAEAASSSSVI